MGLGAAVAFTASLPGFWSLFFVLISSPRSIAETGLFQPMRQHRPDPGIKLDAAAAIRCGTQQQRLPAPAQVAAEAGKEGRTKRCRKGVQKRGAGKGAQTKGRRQRHVLKNTQSKTDGQIKRPGPMQHWARPDDFSCPLIQAGKPSNHLDFRCARAFLPVCSHERDALVFFQCLMAGALNFTIVGKEILAAGLRHDKAEALIVVEPLHNTDFCFQCRS